jgi:leucyl aminopeptidase (aminopeptidase T)
MPPVADEELKRAAHELVKTLRVSEGERFVIVGDAESMPIVTALEGAGKAASADVAALRLDLLRSQSTNHSGERPHKVLPDGVRRAMLAAQASAFVASAPHPESSMRDQLLHIVGACKIRHAHMPAITPISFAWGLAEDHVTLAEIGRSIERRLETAREITTDSPSGTSLVLKAPANRRWVARLGKVGAGEAVVFPTGSIIGSPESVSGRFAASASVGEFFGAREGLLREPLFFDVEDGRVTKVSSASNPHLVQDVEKMLHVATNSDRIGLAILGVNAGIREPTGDVTADQHRPGLHLVFGDPLPKLTAATWTARTSFAACQARSTVRIDGTVVIDDGRIVTA